MTGVRAAALAWTGWTLAVVVTLLGAAVFIPTTEGAERVGGVLFLLVAGLPLPTVGVIVATRRPGNPIGWLFVVVGLGFALSSATDGYLDAWLAGEVDPRIAPGWLAWLNQAGFSLSVSLVATFVPLLFPDGRLPSPRWRPVAWGAAAGTVALWLSTAFWETGYDYGEARNPIAWEAASPMPGAVALVGASLTGMTALAVVGSLAARWRRSVAVERRQLKWFALVAGLVVAVLAIGAALIPFEDEVEPGWLVEVLWGVGFAGVFLGLPLAAAVAILRHDLYDIDRLISRTLAYAVLTAGLGAVYLGGVLLLGRILAPLTRGSDFAVAGSTLAVAGLFRPAQVRVQALVDRRFDRRRYDATVVVETFRARLRDEVELDRLGAALAEAVGAAVSPMHVAVWLRPGAAPDAGEEVAWERG